MRKVVSNTTPILSLLKIDKLDLLRELYSEVIIPIAVYDEIEAGKEGLYYTDLAGIDWIKIQPLKYPSALPYLIDLDRGEAEVLILAREIGADLVILDETLGRRYASLLDLKLTGTIGILLKAKELGLISSVKELLRELQGKGVWLSRSLVDYVTGLAGE